jgi:hypothetical protein
VAYTITRTNYLEVNSVPLSTPAWWIVNLETEIVKRTTRGSNLLLAQATGRRRRRRYLDECVYQFEMRIRGMVKWDGTLHANASDGFIANAEQLTANLGIASSSAVTATWHRTGSASKTASVDIVHFECADLGHRDAKAILEIVAPAGLFA